jgi:hypothetical protein
MAIGDIYSTPIAVVIVDPTNNAATKPLAAASGSAATANAANNVDAVAVSATVENQKNISQNYVFNGTSWDRQRGEINGLVVQPALSSTFWNYASATGGIVNSTTAVTVKAAAGASVRNYISSLQLDNDALGAVTEFAIRDGAAGPVLWRGKLQTTAGSRTVKFDPPLRGTANTLVEVVTLTATVTGGVFANLQGYTGA